MYTHIHIRHILYICSYAAARGCLAYIRIHICISFIPIEYVDMGLYCIKRSIS